ncbi:MAG: hypothetical protein HYT61_02965 [Candidatus Yanofskybacteria bacterium]|nr:hypothetical protein [Candidatus Yanofskybacteria bacterium]
MNKSFLVLFLSVSVFIFSCIGCSVHSRSTAPIPSSLPKTPEAVKVALEENEDVEKIAKENKKRIKTKAQTTEEIDSLWEKLKENEITLATKRAEGVNTSQAEKILDNSKSLLEEAEKLYLEANLTEDYEPVLGILRVIDDSFEKIKQELKRAPRFRDKTKSQPKEFKDGRDVVVEKMGHPDPRNVRVGPMGRFSFQINDGTEMLLSASTCFAPTGGMYTGNSGDLGDQQSSRPDSQQRISGTFQLSAPPKIMIIEYHTGQEGTYQFVFAERNPNLDWFVSNQYLQPQMRDLALANLCQSQGTGFEDYQLVAAYKSKMAGTPEEVLEQLLSGRFRFADQFGLGAIAENAKGGAALANLELVSIVFNTKISRLSFAQADALNKIYNKVKDDLLTSEKGQKAFDKIAVWQNTLSPKKNDKKQFLNLINSNAGGRREIETLVNEFEENLKQLANEFAKIQRELLRFRKNSGVELVFYDDENPVMVLLLQGVGYKVEEASAGTLFKKDIPQISVESKIFYYTSKNDDQPQLVRERRFMINEANKYIDVSKDYQRLTSFMLGWPTDNPLPTGYYQLKLTVTDEVREKAIIYEVNFTVLLARLRVE